MTDEQLVRIFEQAAPPGRALEGVVAGARRKRRKARVAVTLIAAVAVAAIATPLALNLRGDVNTVVAEPAPTSSTAPAATTSPSASASPSNHPPAAPLVTPACAEALDADWGSGELAPEETLPDGAERVWLCARGGWAPQEPLETEPDRVVRAINAAPLPVEPIEACTFIGDLGYSLVIDYPDGRRAVSVETVNCEYIGLHRLGGSALYERVMEMWEAQRATLPDYSGDLDVCSTFPRTAADAHRWPRHSIMWSDPSEATRGAICGLDKTATTYDGPVREVRVPDDLTARLATALGKRPEGVLNAWAAPGMPYLMLLNRFGDPMQIALEPDAAILIDEEPWQLPDDAATELAAVMSPLRVEPLYTPAPLCREVFTKPTPPAAFANIVGGVVCIGEYITPELRPELPTELAQRIAHNFDANAVPTTGLSSGMTIALVLQDQQSRNVILGINADGTALLWEEKRTWPLPDDLKQELQRYGISFEPRR